MRAGYFPLANPLGHLTPPLPKSRSKSLIICLSIFAVLFLAWGISMTVVYAHHTDTHNTTIIDNMLYPEHVDNELQIKTKSAFRCSADTGQCLTTYNIITGGRGGEILLTKNNQCTHMIHMKTPPLTNMPHNMTCNSFCGDICSRSNFPPGGAGGGDVQACLAGCMQSPGDESSWGIWWGPGGGPKTLNQKLPACCNQNWPITDFKFDSIDMCSKSCTKSSLRLDLSVIPASHLQCDAGLTWDPSSKLCVGSPEHPFTFYYEKCPRSTESTSLPRFYPVSNHNTLLDITAGTGQNPDDVLYCMDPKLVKTWVNIEVGSEGDPIKQGNSNNTACLPPPYNTAYWSSAPASTASYMKYTVSADIGCEYTDGTFAEFGECGVYFHRLIANNYQRWVYMCVNYVPPAAKLPKTWPMVTPFMTTAVTAPYQVKYTTKEYYYPAGGFDWWQKTPRNVPVGCNTVWLNCGDCFLNATEKQCGSYYEDTSACLTYQKQCYNEKTEQGCIALSKSFNSQIPFCKWTASEPNLPVSSYTPPYVNGNYFVASAPAYCTSNGKQPWIDWTPFNKASDYIHIYPAPPCLRAHDNQQDCEAPVSGRCELTPNTNIFKKSYLYKGPRYGYGDNYGTKFFFNECTDYVTQSGCEKAYMGYNDYGNTAGWKPWRMPGTGTDEQPASPCQWVPTPAGVATTDGCDNADVFNCGLHCAEYQTHCRTATNKRQCSSTTNNGAPCVWVSSCTWGINGDGKHTISRPCEGDGCYQPCYEKDEMWKCGASQRH